MSASGRSRLNWMSPERVFLITGLTFGLLLLVLTPPFQVPDEAAHLYRAYQVTQGQLLPQRRLQQVGGWIPGSLVMLERRFSSLAATPNNRTTLAAILSTREVLLRPKVLVFVEFPNTALYSPVAYAPQLVAIATAKALGLSTLYLMYLARLASLAVWLALVWWAIRTIPTGKWAVVVLSTIPMLLYLVPSLSADPFVYGLTAVVVAYCVKSCASATPLSSHEAGVLFALAIVVSLVKPPYSLAYLIFLAIPPDRFGTRRRYLSFWTAVLLATLVTGGGWYLAARQYYAPARADVTVSPSAQFSFVLREPAAFFAAVVRTYLVKARMFLNMAIGDFGQFDTPAPVWLRILVLLNIAIGVMSIEGSCNHVKRMFKWIAVAVPFVLFMLLNVLVYMSWSVVGGRLVDGLQGRYFYPLALMLIPSLAMWRRPVIDLHSARAAGLMCALQFVILGATAFVIYRMYY